MGADLVGFIAVFPENPDYTKGAEYLEELCAQAKEILPVIEAARDTDGTLLEITDKYFPADTVRKSTLQRWFTIHEESEEFYDLDELVAGLKDVIEWCGTCTEEHVKNLLFVDGRDVMSRTVTIGRKTYSIIASGELTWGDEPDGDGYQALKVLVNSGLYKAVGGL